MKNILTIIALCTISFIQAQSYSGKGDQKTQVSINFQDHANSIFVSYDLGLAENISIGFASGYAIGINRDYVEKAFSKRFDLKVRFNANIGNVINLDDNFDLYPGLSLSLKNFGAHLGMRYFFTNGFGVFTELNTPIARYKTENLTHSDKIHNQFTVNIGIVFNL